MYVISPTLTYLPWREIVLRRGKIKVIILSVIRLTNNRGVEVEVFLWGTSNENDQNKPNISKTLVKVFSQ